MGRGFSRHMRDAAACAHMVGSITHLDDDISVISATIDMSDSHTIEGEEFKAEVSKQVFCML